MSIFYFHLFTTSEIKKVHISNMPYSNSNFYEVPIPDIKKKKDSKRKIENSKVSLMIQNPEFSLTNE